MDYAYEAERHNNIPDPSPVQEQYIAWLQAEIAALKAEIARLVGCIEALEREDIEGDIPYRGFKNFDAWADAREYNESPHSDHQDGRLDNTSGNFAHLA